MQTSCSPTFSKPHTPCDIEIKTASLRFTTMKSTPTAPYHLCCLILVAFFMLGNAARAQQITGVWNGRIDGHKVELKLIQKGDNLTGTAYYYQSLQRYRQYSVQGYFDPVDNSVVWWDEALLEDKVGGGLLHQGPEANRSVADFNCPGSNRMFLDGTAKKKDVPEGGGGNVALTKVETPLFPDPWDYVINNFTQGTNDPEVIDSVQLVAFAPVAKKEVTAPVAKAEPVRVPSVAAAPVTIEDKFRTREKVFNTEIPVAGDSLELRFYDNAEIDGDSISLFLNGNLLFEHVRLSEKAYTIKLPTNAFDDTAELVMVAENLGTIPPNTSYMIALSGGRRYEARLASTEKSSAFIRLRKAGKHEQ
jgi:hypothetical protein